jgi:hypothetical protein
MGSATEAAAIAGVVPGTVRNWLKARLIRGERTGGGRFRYNLDDVRAMTVSYPREIDADEHIAQLIAAAPEFTPGQLDKIRLILHTAPQAPSSTGGTGKENA